MARTFNGSSQYLQALSAPVSGPPCTFSCWIYATAINRFQAAISITEGTHPTNNEQLRLMVYNTNVVECASFTGPSSFTAATTSGTISVNTWHHIAATFSASAGQYAWLDGAKSASGGNSQTPSGLARVNLGRVYTIATQFFPWEGRLADCAIWSAVLSDDEIKAMATGLRTSDQVRPSALVPYWPLGGLRPDDDRDQWGRAYDLTATGSPGSADHPRLWYPSEPQIMQASAAAAATSFRYRDLTLTGAG